MREVLVPDHEPVPSAGFGVSGASGTVPEKGLSSGPSQEKG